MSRLLNIAIIGGDEPLAEALLKELEERDLPLGAVHPLSLGEVETSVSFNGEDIPCEPAGDFDWNTVDLVFATSRSQAVKGFVDAALAADRPVISVGEALIDHPQAVLTDPDHAPPDAPATRLWIVPDAVAVMLARVLRSLSAALGVERVDAFACLAVSTRGREGIEELRDQAIQLFSMNSTEPGVFPLQIAFNLIPQVGGVRDDGTTGGEAAVQSALQCLLGDGADRIRFSLLWAPVFYGHCIALHLMGGEGLSLENVRARLAAAPGIQLMDERIQAGCPTPATDAAESLDVFVGRLRAGDSSGGKSVQLWLVGDNLRLEAANLALIAERLIEKQLKSVIS